MIIDEKYEKEAEQRVPQDWLEGETREKPKKKARVKKFKQP
jgi:hypothetical protein